LPSTSQLSTRRRRTLLTSNCRNQHEQNNDDSHSFNPEKKMRRLDFTPAASA